jgi:hypothetical protein
LVPDGAILQITTVELPVSVMVSVCEPLGVLMSCGAKFRLGGERVRVSGSRRI